MDGVALEALADINEQAAVAFHHEFGGRYLTTEPDRIFEDRSIDAVLICTHHDSHTSLALKAAAAGKHILIEKPMALTSTECARIAAAVEAAGLVLTVNFKFRFAPAVIRTKQIIPRPIVTLGQLAMERMPEGIWVRDPIRGGGLILATACHVFDMIYWLNESEPVRVHAEGSPETPAAATVRFANGAVAALVMAEAGENPHVGKWLHEVFDGARSAVLYDHFRKVRFSGAEDSEFAAPDDMHADGAFGLMQDFLHAIQTGAKPVIGARDGLRATLLGEKILDSLRSGGPEEVDLGVAG